MNYIAFQKDILKSIVNKDIRPYLYAYDGDNCLLVNSVGSCMMVIPKCELVVPLKQEHESSCILSLLKIKQTPVSILPCFEGKKTFMFLDEKDNEWFFNTRLISYFADKKTGLTGYRALYADNMIRFYIDDLLVGVVLRIKELPLPKTYSELLEKKKNVRY